MKRVELEGKRYGRWLVIKEDNPIIDKHGHPHRMVKCICDCGNVRSVRVGNLLNGKTNSCGCLSAEKRLLSTRTHGMTHTRIHNEWNAMRARCKYDKHYKDVSFCDKWKIFNNFKEWAYSNGYSDNLTLDRIDPFGNYEPSNCRWVTMKEQARNKRNTKRYEMDGVSLTVGEWAEIFNLPVTTVKARLRNGLDIKTALTKLNVPNRKVYCVETNKTYISRKECCKEMGLSMSGVSQCANGKIETYRGYHFRNVEE